MRHSSSGKHLGPGLSECLFDCVQYTSSSRATHRLACHFTLHAGQEQTPSRLTVVLVRIVEPMMLTALRRSRQWW
jgi:hypothetical protein